MHQIASRIRAHPLLGALVVFCIVALAKGSYGFAVEMSRQLGAPLYLDAKIYFAVGRGILNGLEPYSQIFESKTPIIFLISAFSLLTSGDQRVANLLQVIVLTGMPVASVFFFRKESRGLTREQRLFWQIFGLGLGLGLGHYAAMRAAYIQTESFGAFFGMLYVFAFARTHAPVSWKRIALLGVLFLLSAGIKEPFCFILLASVLILCRDRWQFLYGFVVPGLIAGILGLLLLLSLGSLGSYVDLYIPYMSQTHVYLRGSPWSRGFDLLPTLTDLFTFSPFLLAAIVLLVVLFIVSPKSGWKEWTMESGRLLMSLYLVAFVVGLAGPYYPHHFVFPLPFYAALAVFVLRQIFDGAPNWYKASSWLLLGLFSAMVLFLPVAIPTWTAAFRVHPDEAKFHAVAEQVDTLMDRCAFERYLAYGWELEDLTSRTRHSPYGSSFNSFSWGIDRTIPAFTELFVQRLNETPVIILYESRIAELDGELGGTLNMIFTRSAPECATESLPIGEYVFLFRK